MLPPLTLLVLSGTPGQGVIRGLASSSLPSPRAWAA